ncbi:MAG: hypothetical protein E6H92_04230 [Chloroflexi bacterium]|nr:MAG: hypothetical protein E6H92_04230 [Chloroflexota bacterium]
MPLTALLAAAAKGPLDTWSPTFFSGWTLFLPLIALLLIVTFTIDSRRASAWISVFFALVAFAGAVVLLAIELRHPAYKEHTLTFLQFFTGQSGVASEFTLQWGFLADPLAAAMLLMVTGVSLFTQVYALGYLRREDGVVRFYLSASFMTFSMSGVVLSTSYGELYFFWALTSVATFVLVGHWWQRDAAARAARKVLLVTQVGDIGLLAGIIYIFFRFHDLGFQALRSQYAGGKVGQNGLLIMSLLVFAGVVGKAAQLPLHTWAPDSAEAPAPAAALIHGAAMAATGVYLLARTYPLFIASPRALTVVAVVGGVTAVAAALWALAEDNLKRLIAYATISEIGLAVLAFGAGAFSASVFQAFAHGWSKALLFLGAGIIVRELRTESIAEMGGLWRRMRTTGVLMLIGAAAAAGIPPLSGFVSKDAILSQLLSQPNAAVTAVVMVVTFLSGLYMFRMFFSVFAGPTVRRRRFEPERIRDPGGRIRTGMVALAVFAAAVGLFDLVRAGPEFVRFVTFPGQKSGHAASLIGSVLTSLAALLGLAVALLVYGLRALPASRISGRVPFVPRALSRAFYLGDAYRWGTENAVLRAGQVADWVDRVVIDGAVDRVGGGVAGMTGPFRWAPSPRIPQLALGAFAGLLLLGILAGAVLGHLKL